MQDAIPPVSMVGEVAANLKSLDPGSKWGFASNTDYTHSVPAPMDPETREKLISRFQPRVSKHDCISHDACIEAQVDVFDKDNIGKVIGGMNAYNSDFTALCAAEALPERIGLCSYFIEYAFVHDDVTIDAIPTCGSEFESNDILKRALGHEGIKNLIKLDESALKRKHARAKIWNVLNKLDLDYACRSQKAWRQWFETGHGMRDANFTNLEEYLATRALDCGANWVVRLMGWASGVELTPEEEEETGPITYLAFVALAVTNDIWSLEKEKRVTKQSNGSNPLINAVNMVMKMHNMDEETAKKMVLEIIWKHEDQYCQLRDEYLKSSRPSPAIRKWFQILEVAMGGNALWSINAIRYHSNVKNPYHGDFRMYSVFEGLEWGHAGTNANGKPNGSECNGAEPQNAVFKTLTGLDDSVLWKPYYYIMSMKTKGFRQQLIEALQLWYMVPQKSLVVISAVASMLHESSLMLDDIQDGSSLRRGKPAVHEVFGVGQTINSACFQINNTLCLIQQLSPSAISIFTDQMAQMYIGQGHDIAWTNHKTIPSEADYLRMVDGKTGGLFMLLYRLMRNEATQNRGLDLSHLMNQMGRYYQIRDDYQNLISQEYMSQRGYCQDLDEGKLSFPFIHTHQKLGNNDTILTNLLHMRDRRNGLSREAKEYILKQIEESGSLDYTQDLLDQLLSDIQCTLGNMETVTGKRNWVLQSMMSQLRIGREKSAVKESTFANVLRVWGAYGAAAWRTKLN